MSPQESAAREAADRKPGDSPPAAREAAGPASKRGSRRGERNSAFRYISLLFAAAFLLLLVTFFMEQRRNDAVIEGLTESLTGLNQSASALQSVQDMYRENEALRQQAAELEERVETLEGEHLRLLAALEQAAAEREALERAQAALDWFWQIDEAYVRGRYATARNLIRQLEELGLAEALPRQSVTDNDRFAPLDRYREIYDILF